MKKVTVLSDVRYNVVCIDCRSVWQPLFKTALWWQAKKREQEGFLDALHVDGEKCGCKKKVVNPDALIRVFGYTDDFREFDFAFTKFTDAVKTFKAWNDGMTTVFISGVSNAVERRIQYGY